MSSAELVIQAAGPATALQDAGRFGWQRFGLGPAGAMDRWSLAVANALVGNAPGAAAIELVLMGARFDVAGGPVRLALAGADCELKVDGRIVPPLTGTTAPAGSRVEIGSARGGAFAYLAVGGSFAVAPELGSLSLHHRAQIGPFGGRPLRAGDRLPVIATAGEDLTLAHAPQRAAPPGEGPIRVVLGPQDDHFTPAGIATLLGGTYTIEQADRMGLRLAGPKVEHGDKGYNIVSDGIATGAMQVPGNGLPIVLLADRQTTGGYPKIAVIAGADIPRLAQMRPGAAIRFAAIAREAAIALARETAAAADAMRAALQPAVPELTTERLLASNLVGGWIDGGDGQP